MDLDEYKRLYGDRDDAAPGWDAIDSRLVEVYGGQEPKHWGTALNAIFGGPDPIDGISAYECRDGGVDHLHFCTYGYSSLYYDEEGVGGDFSGYGFEMTFRLASPLPPVEEPMWALVLLQKLARYVFGTGRVFEPYDWAGGEKSSLILPGVETDIVGLAFLPDPRLAPIDTPHGRVDFLQAFGLTTAELDAIRSKARTCEDVIAENRRGNPLLITDLARKSP